MNERDELPNWTGGTEERPEVAAYVPAPAPPRRGRSALMALLGLAVLVGMGAIGYFLAQRQADDNTTTDGEVAAPSVDEDADDATSDESDESIESSSNDDALTVAVDETAEGDAAAEDDEDADATTDESEDADTDSSEESDAASDAGTDSARTAVFRGGKLYLGGKVPSQEIADVIEERAVAVVGPDNVVVEYEIDPSVVIDPGESTPLFVEDVVLFGFNSVSIERPFLPLLDLGTVLLRQNPQASLTVITRTDAIGSAEVNLEVATKRADAVIAYWVSKGVNPDQLTADPRGEEGASEDDDEETAALQRRAEFIITGLLD